MTWTLSLPPIFSKAAPPGVLVLYGTMSLRRCRRNGATAVPPRRRSLATTTTSKSNKRPPVTRATTSGSGSGGGVGVEGVWYTPRRGRRNGVPASSSLDVGRYGLSRVDYAAMGGDPPVWTLPPHPPARSVGERVVFPLTVAVAAGVGAWAVLASPEEEEDMRDYWRRVETGQILVDDDDDEDEEEDDEDEED